MHTRWTRPVSLTPATAGHARAHKSTKHQKSYTDTKHKSFHIPVHSNHLEAHLPTAHILARFTPPLRISAAAMPAQQLNTIRKAFDPPVWPDPFIITNIRDATHTVHLLV